MARKTAKDGELRKCPVCETPVADTVDLGLRDFSWVNEGLEKKLGMMDFDAVLSQAATGRMLVLELKPRGARVSTGARLTFAALVQAGYDVWILWDQGDGNVKLGICNDRGRTPEVGLLPRANAADMVRSWWEAGL